MRYCAVVKGNPPGRFMVAGRVRSRLEGRGQLMKKRFALAAVVTAGLLALAGCASGPGSYPSGQQGARILTLRASVGAQEVVFRAKWRAQSSANILNEPRKELGAHAVQQLFLDLPMHPACDSPRAKPEKPCAFDEAAANA